MFYSIQRTLKDIEGHASTTHKSQKHMNLSQNTLSNKINSILDGEHNNNFKKIIVKPEQIDFGDSHKHANNVEIYINSVFYEKLLEHYALHRGENTKGKLLRLDDALKSTPTLRKIVSQYSSIVDLNGDYHFTVDDIDNIDKQINRRVSAIMETARKEYYKYDEEITHLKTKSIDVNNARDQLKNLLNEEQWHELKKEILKTKTINSNPEIAVLLNEIIDIYY